MSLFFIDGNENVANTATIANSSSTNRSFIKNISVARNSVDSIGSKVIDNENTNSLLPSGVFANNNQKPINLFVDSLAGVSDKRITGNLVADNYTKEIKSVLTATAIRENKFDIFSGKFDNNYPSVFNYQLCPDKQSVSIKTGNLRPISKNSSYISCDQNALVFPEIPSTPQLQLFVDNDGNLQQNGIVLRFRSLDDKSYTWKSIFVPNSKLKIAYIPDENGIISENSETITSVDLKNVLPDGEYQIQYDLLNPIASMLTTGEINTEYSVSTYSSTESVTNSTVSHLYKIEFSGCPDFPEYSGNINSPYYEYDLAYYNKFTSFLKGILNGTYYVGASGPPDQKEYGQAVVGTFLWNRGMSFNTNPPSGPFDFPENYNIIIDIQAEMTIVTSAGIIIASETFGGTPPTQTAFASVISIVNALNNNGPEYAGWAKSYFDEAGGLDEWTYTSCEVNTSCPKDSDDGSGGFDAGYCIDCGGRSSNCGQYWEYELCGEGGLPYPWGCGRYRLKCFTSAPQCSFSYDC